ncbi:hypothetical protein GOBAR_AA04806 [Gossypium barbadense]|uniref:Piwi domain-containing protein n=1 Tax=Gossypium barbadense TaxID=3634 RepID=A0A2P5YJL9_GOSBA|nr:hypothetical protein GOBAR_AA04806 [Gossypium barbadense]
MPKVCSLFKDNAPYHSTIKVTKRKKNEEKTNYRRLPRLVKIGIRNYRLLSMLTLGQRPSIPVVSKVPTIILGMGALFGFPEQSDVPSIAAMVSSRRWPLISSYGASVSDKVDDGIMKEALLDFYTSSGKRKPDQIIIFRDGVSESQFNQACKFLDEKWNPKDCGYCCTKNHHTKFFQQGSPDNVLHGTVIDNKVCHPKNNDFYLGTHAGMIGITRQTHYHVLLDQAGFLADDLQEFVHSLSYMYHHSYIFCGSYFLGQFMKIRDASETSSSHGGMYAPGVISVPQLSRLKDKVSNFILIC